MEKKFSKLELAVIKNAAKLVLPFVNKKEKLTIELNNIEQSKQAMIDKFIASIDQKLAAKVAKTQDDITNTQNIIDSIQKPIVTLTGGYTIEDITTVEVIKTGKIDTKTGKEILKKNLVLKYPDTVLPPESAASEELSADLTAEPSSPSQEEEMKDTCSTSDEEIMASEPEELPEEVMQEEAMTEDEENEFLGNVVDNDDPFAVADPSEDWN